jgi:hypothetical protein
LGGVVAGALGLLLAGDWDLALALALGRVATFRLVLAAGFDLAFPDGDLVRPTVRALDLVFALLFVFAFALALAFADFDFFLATMRPPSAPNDPVAWRRRLTTTKVDGQAETSDRNMLAKNVSYTELLRNAMA